MQERLQQHGLLNREIGLQMITTVIEMFDDTTALVKFGSDILFKCGIESMENVQPPHTSYAEMLRLKGNNIPGHHAIAKRVQHIIMRLLERTLPLPTLRSVQRMIHQLAHRHIATIPINAFSEQSNQQNGILTEYRMYYMLCRFNHSCTPNIDYYIDDDEMTCGEALSPIKKGEQLFISYLPEADLAEDVKTRKTITQETWKFPCKCQKCAAESQDPSPVPVQKLKCPLCDVLCSKKANLKAHIKKHHVDTCTLEKHLDEAEMLEYSIPVQRLCKKNRQKREPEISSEGLPSARRASAIRVLHVPRTVLFEVQRANLQHT